MRNKAETTEGWDIINEGTLHRTIKIGFYRNCNDELMKDPYLYEEIRNTLISFNINRFKLSVLDTNNEYSIDVRLSEDNYQKLKNEITIS